MMVTLDCCKGTRYVAGLLFLHLRCIRKLCQTGDGDIYSPKLIVYRRSLSWLIRHSLIDEN